ncbi:MAG: BatA domain-containing protein [Granulosicoccaceae bacterium]
MSVQWPWYLFGLLLLGLPWLLHLFSRHFAPERPFPSKQFLEAADPPKSRTRQLQYRSLFVLRSLMLLALCALFAMPWFNRTQSAQAVTHINYLVIDHSLSMRSEGRWESAIELMDTHINELNTEDIKLFTFDGALNATTRSTIKAPGFLSADFGDLIRQLDARASSESLPVHVTLISDAQQTSVPVHKNAMLYSTIEQLSIKRVANLDAVNFSLNAAARSFDGVHAHIKVTLSASTSNDSSQTYERTVEVTQGDRVVASQLISIKSGENKELVLEQIPLPASSDITFDVRILEQDALAEDNQLQVVAIGSNPEPVSIVQYNDLASPAALVFIETALRADGIATMNAVTEAGLTSGESISHAIAFISAEDRAALPTSLTDFVAAGGNALVMLVPSDTSAIESGAGLDDDAKGSEITFVDQVHALALNRSDWSSVKLYSNDTYSVRSSEQILLQSATGAPLLTEQLSDAGRLFFLHDALDGTSSNLPHQAAFVEMLHSLVNYFSTLDVVPNVIEVGQALNLPSRMRLIKPDGDAIGQLTDTGKPQLLLLDEPGIYTLLEQTRERALMVNLDPAESDIAAMPLEATNAWQSRALPEDTTVSETAVSNAINSAEIRQDVWQYLLPLFAVLLLFESMFANRHLGVKRDGSI